MAGILVRLSKTGLKRGFLDGYPGYVMSRLMARYEFVSIAKYREMRLNENTNQQHKK